MIRLAPLAAALLALSACSGSEETEPIGAVTQSEAEALDDAAEMIEARRLPEGALPAEDGADAAGAPAARGTLAPAPRESGGPEPMELPDE